MKCLICKHGFSNARSVEEYQEQKKDTCGVCKKYSRYTQKTEEDIVDEGVKMYEHKMGLPQYAAYKDNPKAAEHLLKDCIREAGFSNAVNTKSLGLLTAKGGAHG